MRDRDRFEHGRRCLTLRMIYVRVMHLPPDSAVMGVARKGKPHWSLEADIADATRRMLGSTEKKKLPPHPARPSLSHHGTAHSPERRRKLADARKRAAERRSRLSD